jgi:drug/metabolite transporter (DMT)-like permease
VFGALSSVLFWHEVMTARMVVGCIIIFAAIIVNEVDFTAIFISRKSRKA